MWFTTVFVTLRSQLGFSEADRQSYFHIEGSSVQSDVGVFSRVTFSTRLSYTATALSTSFAMGLRELFMLLMMISMDDGRAVISHQQDHIKNLERTLPGTFSKTGIATCLTFESLDSDYSRSYQIWKNPPVRGIVFLRKPYFLTGSGILQEVLLNFKPRNFEDLPPLLRSNLLLNLFQANSKRLPTSRELLEPETRAIERCRDTMASRFTKEEKGKHHLSGDMEPTIKRIKARYVDNSILIKENRLTLIGRVTNPQEQKIWALLPTLPRKWHLQGKVTGSDLGNGCFQFRFEKGEELQRVLDNRPYHFAYWMIILQRWEPVISATFPSQIPFWIRIKGLPLHYWHEDMICDIGKELGMLLNHELTKTSARIKVLIDGLKPLEKKSIIEFDSGEESLIYLEYERLENHCSLCQSLSHLKEDCPKRTERNKTLKLQAEEDPYSLGRNFNHNSSKQDTHTKGRELTNFPVSQERNLHKKDGTTKSFNERVDRHGNSFGERVATKQTRVPPPARALITKADKTQN
ncbi:LOW QUALITY PROTEIN: hypothetical protein YC2023_100960 [Brassica napus]